MTFYKCAYPNPSCPAWGGTGRGYCRFDTADPQEISANRKSNCPANIRDVMNWLVNESTGEKAYHIRDREFEMAVVFYPCNGKGGGCSAFNERYCVGCFECGSPPYHHSGSCNKCSKKCSPERYR